MMKIGNRSGHSCNHIGQTADYIFQNLWYENLWHTSLVARNTLCIHYET